jgi:multidrug resistance efflux pump
MMFPNCKNMPPSKIFAVMPVAIGQPAHGVLDGFPKRLAQRASLLAVLSAATISSASHADNIKASTSVIALSQLLIRPRISLHATSIDGRSASKDGVRIFSR